VLLSTIVRELIAAGLSGDRLVAAIERIEPALIDHIRSVGNGTNGTNGTKCPIVPRDNPKRERELVRKRLYRHKKKLEAQRLLAAGLSQIAIPALSKTLKEAKKEEEASSLREEAKKEERAQKPKSGTKWPTKIPLPTEFRPTAQNYNLANQLGVSSDLVGMKFNQMQSWARSKGERRCDWAATLDGFIIRASQEQSKEENIWRDNL
jgi:hypothetical protein